MARYLSGMYRLTTKKKSSKTYRKEIPRTMLILTRYIGEALKIGDEITITTINAERNQVKLGIKAPKHIAVDREEIYHRKKNSPLPLTPDQGQKPAKKLSQIQSYKQQRTVDDTAKHQANPQTNPIPAEYTDAPQLTGNILFIKKSAGYGFIYTPGQDSNIYFHATDVLGNQFCQLEEGSDVSFRPIQGPRGLIAKQVDTIA